jgi:tetratricopeptide (TPR) repeat protein
MITCLHLLADVADHAGDLRNAVALHEEALVLAEELDSALDVAELLTNRAAYRLRAGDLAGAEADCERAVALARRAGAPESLAVAHKGLADIARLRGDLPGARALAEQALAECPTGWFSSNAIRAGVQVARARIAVAAGDADGAREPLRDAVTFDPEVLRMAAEAAATAAEAAAALALLDGDPRQAGALLGAAEALRGSPGTEPDSTRVLDDVRAALGGGAVPAAPADRETAVELLTSYVRRG